MLNTLKRAWYKNRLTDPAYQFLFEEPPPDEWVSIDCETTGLDRQHDHIISVGAVRMAGQRVLTSQRLDVMVKPDNSRLPMNANSVRIHQLRETDLDEHGLPPLEVAKQVLQFIGARPLVGYYLEFDVAMLNRALWPMLGVGLPQTAIEVSAMYYEHKFRQLPPYQQHANADIDLRFATLMDDLGLPRREAHDALNDAVMAALAFVKLRQLHGAG